MLSSKRKIYEGKAKVLYAVDADPNVVIQHFKDDITANNNQKKAVIPGKGIINNYISEYFMLKLESIGIKTHFIRSLNMREQLVKKVQIIPLEIVVRNIAAGSICKRLGITEGTIFQNPILEFYYKNDKLFDPLVTEAHILTFEWLNDWELDEIKLLALRINDFLSGAFSTAGIKLVDLKVEFGFYNDIILLADEISPDNCRLWDALTYEKMDKDRFRLDLGDLVKYYKSIAKRLGILSNIFN